MEPPPDPLAKDAQFMSHWGGTKTFFCGPQRAQGEEGETVMRPWAGAVLLGKSGLHYFGQLRQES